jgi:hypothetical protein
MLLKNLTISMFPDLMGKVIKQFAFMGRLSAPQFA